MWFTFICLVALLVPSSKTDDVLIGKSATSEESLTGVVAGIAVGGFFLGMVIGIVSTCIIKRLIQKRLCLCCMKNFTDTRYLGNRRPWDTAVKFVNTPNLDTEPQCAVTTYETLSSREGDNNTYSELT